jgi:hypothetical protein
MMDIEFLSAEAVEGVVLYRYQSGCLRQAVIDKFISHVQAAGLYVCEQSLEELEQNWSAGGLWPSARWCELPRSSEALRRIKSNLATEPGAPTLILVKAAKFNDIRHPLVQVINEPIVSAANIRKVIDFAAQYCEFARVKSLVGSELHGYFRAWIRYEQEASLGQVLSEFDLVTIRYWNEEKRRLDLPPVVVPEPARRSTLAHDTGRFLLDPCALERANVMRAFSLRASRFGRNVALDDLFAVAVKHACQLRVPERRARPAASAEAALLWACICLVHCEVARSKSEVEGASIAIHHALVTYASRALKLAADPLVGYWQSLRDSIASAWRPVAAANDANEDEIDPLRGLLSLMIKCGQEHRDVSWLAKLSRIARAKLREPSAAPVVKGFTSVRPDYDPKSFSEVFGQHHIVEAIRRRVKSGDHSRPLLLSGPYGAGKRTLARLYAKRLLCEGLDQESLDPCGVCAPCKAFSSGAIWGYLEFDMARPRIVEGARYHLEQLKHEPISERRAIVLRDPDYSPDATDAFLKTLENGAKKTTFILLTTDEERTRPAILSRCDRFAVKPVWSVDAHELVNRWLPIERRSEPLTKIIVLHGGGRPGLMYHLSRMAAEQPVWTAEDAKALFGLDCGQRMLNLIAAAIGGQATASGRSLRLPTQAYAGTQLTLSQFVGVPDDAEALFAGLIPDLQRVKAAMEHQARKLKISADEMWIRLAMQWLHEDVFDDETLSAALRQTARNAHIAHVPR